MKEKQRVEAADKREHPHAYLWLKCKIEVITILMHQRRFDDCQDCIAITRLECSALNDLYFSRQLLEVEFAMEVLRGDHDSALRTAEKVRKHATAYHQADLPLASFLGNLSEFMYNSRKGDCVDASKEGRLIIWLKLRDYGLDLEPQNINGRGDVRVNKARVKPNEQDALAQFQSAPAQAAPGGKGAPAAQKGAPPAKPAPGGKGQPVPTQEVELPVEEEKAEGQLDFSQKVEHPLVSADAAINSSYVEPNIYLRGLETAVRFDVRYA